MNNRGTLARAIRGPILLITIGSLIAFDTFDGYSFARTWPVIIIMLGILKLFERMTDRPQEPPQPGAQTGTGVPS
jgi:hypothetical protein